LNPDNERREILPIRAFPGDFSSKKGPRDNRDLLILLVLKRYGECRMGVQTWRLKGIPKKDLRSRIANKRAKELWHFGPKEKGPKKNTEPVEIMIRRMRFS
jgi:hypothetical protein